MSTEGEPAVKAYEQSVMNTDNGKKSKKKTEVGASETGKNQEEFEAMKKKTKKILLGMLAAVAAAVVGVVAYKSTH